MLFFLSALLFRTIFTAADGRSLASDGEPSWPGYHKTRRMSSQPLGFCLRPEFFGG